MLIHLQQTDLDVFLILFDKTKVINILQLWLQSSE